MTRTQSLHALDLLEFELDRCGAAEDADADLHAAAVEVEFFNQAVEGREGAVEDLDAVADLIIDVDLLLGARGRGGVVSRRTELASFTLRP